MKDGFKRQCRQRGSLTLHEDLTSSVQTSTALLAWSLSLLQTQSARNRRYPHCALRTLRAKGTWYLQMTFPSQASSLRDGLKVPRGPSAEGLQQHGVPCGAHRLHPHGRARASLLHGHVGTFLNVRLYSPQVSGYVGVGLVGNPWVSLTSSCPQAWKTLPT